MFSPHQPREPLVSRLLIKTKSKLHILGKAPANPAGPRGDALAPVEVSEKLALSSSKTILDPRSLMSLMAANPVQWSAGMDFTCTWYSTNHATVGEFAATKPLSHE